MKRPTRISISASLSKAASEAIEDAIATAVELDSFADGAAEATGATEEQSFAGALAAVIAGAVWRLAEDEDRKELAERALHGTGEGPEWLAAVLTFCKQAELTDQDEELLPLGHPPLAVLELCIKHFPSKGAAAKGGEKLVPVLLKAFDVEVKDAKKKKTTRVAEVKVVTLDTPPQPYSSSAHFALGQRVDHAKFGRGVVVSVAVDRCSIRFDDGERKLLQGTT